MKPCARWFVVGVMSLLWCQTAWGQPDPKQPPDPPPDAPEAEPEPEPPPTRIVTGLVERAGSGDVVAGVAVQVAGTEIRTVTGDNGFFILVGVPVGDVVLELLAPDIETERITVSSTQRAVRVAVRAPGPDEPTGPPASSRSIEGVVLEAETGDPIPGAVVTLRGSNISVIADEAGRFRMPDLPVDDVELEITNVSHQTQIVTVPPDRRAVTISLVLTGGEQILVVGRAPQIVRQNLANGASVVQGEDLSRISANSIDDAMQGKIAGANIQRNNGAPGGGVQLRLRGVSTINGSSSPLYVIDGVIVSNVAIPSGISVVTSSTGGSNSSSTQDNQVNRIADIDINDIESVEVLKGPAAAALYGSKAANGVVIITTKRGRPGALRVSVTQRFGTHQVANSLGSRRFETVDEAMDAFGPAAADHFQAGRSFDHEDQLFSAAGLARETIASLSGGGDTSTYFGSFLIADEPGVLTGSGYEKQSARIGFTQRFGRRLMLGVAANLLHTTASRGMTQNDNAGVSHYMVLPFTPNFLDLSRNADGTYPVNPFIGSGTNPLQTVALMNDEEDVWRFIGAGHANFRLLDAGVHKVDLTGMLGADWFQQQNDLLFPPELFFEDDDGFPGTSLDTNSEFLGVNGSLNAAYRHDPDGSWRSVTSGGLLLEQRELGTVFIVSRNLTAGQPNLDAGTQVSVNESRLLVKDRGGYVQQEVSLLDDALNVLGAVLIERSSVNGDTDSLFLFPKAAAVYKVPEISEQVGLLRLRGAYGEVGNQPLYGQKFTPLDASQNIEGNSGVGVAGIAGDSGIEPERQREIELGVDLVAWQDRLVVEVTGYQRSISNLILQRTPAPSTGISTEFFNGGELRNRGVELQVQVTPVDTGTFTWLSRTTFTLNRNEITDLDVPPFLTGGFGTGLGAFRIEKGKSATQIVGNSGLDEDGNCCAVEQLGDAEPDFRVGFANHFQYGSWGLTSLWDWQQGSEVINLTKFLYDLGQNTADYEENGAQRLMDQATNAGVYIEDGSYLKLRELSLHYDLPASFVRQLGPMNSARVSLSGRNLLTFTPYTGLDPEVSNFGNQPIARNIDVAPFPPVRSYWFSVRAGF